MNKVKLAVLGCTGSIGAQTLGVVDFHPELFEVTALCANHDGGKLLELAQKYHSRYICLTGGKTPKLDGAVSLEGMEGACALAALEEADVIVVAQSTMAAIYPLISAVKAGKRIALANKESVVCGGKLMQRLIAQSRAEIVPVDSEMSAIFQCLRGQQKRDLESLVLTASGGPFRGFTRRQLKNVTLEDALEHPNWSMGKKITVDSACMVNKGLEVIEAGYLFGVDADHIEVLLQPSSTIHSMVRMRDGALLAQMGVPDMAQAIQYALTYPDRLPSTVKGLDFSALGKIEFFQPDNAVFPALSLAFKAYRAGGTATAVYNAAAEVGTELFLQRSIGLYRIAEIIDYTLNKLDVVQPGSFEELFEYDTLARETARSFGDRRYFTVTGWQGKTRLPSVI